MLIPTRFNWHKRYFPQGRLIGKRLGTWMSLLGIKDGKILREGGKVNIANDCAECCETPPLTPHACSWASGVRDCCFHEDDTFDISWNLGDTSDSGLTCCNEGQEFPDPCNTGVTTYQPATCGSKGPARAAVQHEDAGSPNSSTFQCGEAAGCGAAVLHAGSATVPWSHEIIFGQLPSLPRTFFFCDWDNTVINDGGSIWCKNTNGFATPDSIFPWKYVAPFCSIYCSSQAGDIRIGVNVSNHPTGGNPILDGDTNTHFYTAWFLIFRLPNINNCCGTNGGKVVSQSTAGNLNFWDCMSLVYDNTNTAFNVVINTPRKACFDSGTGKCRNVDGGTPSCTTGHC